MNHGHIPSGYVLPKNTDPNLYENPLTSYVVLMVSRRDIERQDIEPLMRLLQTLTASPHALLRRAGTLRLVIDGYNDDPRDVCEVAEIRKYFEAVEARWPYMPLFLEHTIADFTFYLSLVANARRLTNEGKVLQAKDEGAGDISTRFLDAPRLKNVITRCTQSITELLVSFNLQKDQPEFDQVFTSGAEALSVMNDILGKMGPMMKAV